MEEVKHISEVLEATKRAISEGDSLKLNELSSQTIHCASTVQDAGSIGIAVLVYSLSKIVEKKSKMNFKNWNEFVRRLNSFLSLAITAALEKNEEKYDYYLEQARKSLLTISINVKPYIEQVLRKASINKASRMYEHGISLGKTAQLLGITEWELSEYTGQNSSVETEYNKTLDIRKRAKMALEFFS